MSRGCELRQVSQEEAQLFLRHPEKLLELEQARHEAYKSKGYVAEAIDPNRQFYDWHVLTAVVSDSAAWTLLVECGQQIGETEQMWRVLDATARVLSARQVRTLNVALTQLLADVNEQALIDLAMLEKSDFEWPWRRPEVEINLELYWIKQKVQQFIQKVAEENSALLIIA